MVRVESGVRDFDLVLAVAIALSAALWSGDVPGGRAVDPEPELDA